LLCFTALNALFITGPTAVGKSEIALEVAERCNGEIVGADAFQIYAGLDILSAKPSPAERRRVPHHLVDFVPVTQSFDVAQYLEAAQSCIAEIRSRKKLPVVVGGTGLYLRALTRGLSDLPKADAALRAQLDAAPFEELQQRITALDPDGAGRIDLKNKRRLIRAIEVCILTGKPFSNFRNEWKTLPENITAFLLARDREDLCERIDRRVIGMFRNGAIDEVRRLADAGPTASQAIGFREIRALLAGKINDDECITLVQQATRRYAKRQLTWFRREPFFESINLSQNTDLESAIAKIVRRCQNECIAAD
jgi:tRNA dimethylallyltransferase